MFVFCYEIALHSAEWKVMRWLCGITYEVETKAGNRDVFTVLRHNIGSRFNKV